MSISTGVLGQFEYEMSVTRKFLACLPEDKLGWKPHVKSATLGSLATHLMNLPTWVPGLLTTESLDVSGFTPTPLPETREALLSVFDQHVAAGRAAIANASDEDFMKTWTLLAGGKTIFAMPRIAVMHTMVLSHTIHHRAQLGVYYRLNDIPVLQSYGPSADEPM